MELIEYSRVSPVRLEQIDIRAASGLIRGLGGLWRKTAGHMLSKTGGVFAVLSSYTD